MRYTRAFKTPATDDDFAEIEGLLGWSLPVDYRDSMSTVNGGLLEQNSIELGVDEGSTIVDAILTLDRRAGVLSVLGVMANESMYRDNSSLPIAADGLGNHFAMIQSGDVFFVDHESDSVDFAHCIRVAASFSEFDRAIVYE